jgi:hypothetical protein
MTKKDPRRFYVYLWLRSKDSEHGAKFSPYYVGKGRGNRAFEKCGRTVPAPRDSSYIAFVQEGLTEAEAFSLEIYCIQLYGRIDLGTGILRNRTDGGEGTSGTVVSEETRRKLSRARLREKNPRWGKSHTQEARDKIAKARTGTTHTLETKNKLSQILLGNKRNLGKRHTQETRRKMSRGHLGAIHTQETKSKITQSNLVYLYELIDSNGEVYITDNLTDFARQYSLHQSALQQVVNNKRNHHKGWTGRILEGLK